MDCGRLPERQPFSVFKAEIVSFMKWYTHPDGWKGYKIKWDR